MRSIFVLVATLALAFPAPVRAQDAQPATTPAAEAASPPPPAPAAQAPAAQDITIELNKLEATEKACRGYFIVENKTPAGLKELQIDVFLFDKQSVILRRVALSFLDIRPGRSKVVLFDLADLDCGSIGRLLVNEVIACTAADGKAVEGCADRLAVRTRAGAEFEY